MPGAAPSRCLSCRQLVVGKCTTCEKPWKRKPKTWQHGSTRAWRVFRAAYLRDHPLCVGLDDTGCDQLATVVDHLDGCDYDTNRLNPDWCRPLCTDHHDIRTGRQGAEARPR